MFNSRSKVGVASLAFGLALGVVGTIGSSSVIADQPTKAKKITICHATGAESNPYIKITVAYTAVDGNTQNGHSDHLNHTGPVWYPGAKAAGVHWGDIIPPVDGVTPGLNWADGQATFDNNCKYVAPPTVKAAATTTAAKQTSTTAVLSGSQTTTAVLSGSQTTTAVLAAGGTVPGSEGLPATGRESSGMLLLGGIFVVFGTVLLGLTRRSAIR